VPLYGSDHICALNKPPVCFRQDRLWDRYRIYWHNFTRNGRCMRDAATQK
jgi:hypothetical protein